MSAEHIPGKSWTLSLSDAEDLSLLENQVRHQLARGSDDVLHNRHTSRLPHRRELLHAKYNPFCGTSSFRLVAVPQLDLLLRIQRRILNAPNHCQHANLGDHLQHFISILSLSSPLYFHLLRNDQHVVQQAIRSFGEYRVRHD